MIVRIVITLLIIAGCGARLTMLAGGRESLPDTAALDREALTQEIADTSRADANADDAVRPLCYSPVAAIILGVGPDDSPGRANFDDNRNGVVDDRGEMGAVGSDDRCAGPLDDGYDQMLSDPNTIAISTGTFQPCDSGQQPSRYLTRRWGWFVAE